MEILLINDGSRDGSADICRRWADEYENIHFYSKENEGLSKTRNFGLRHAQGKYIFFLDSDDTLAPDTVKSVVDYFDTVYNEVDLVTYRITQYFKMRRRSIIQIPHADPHGRVRFRRPQKQIHHADERQYLRQE